MIHRPETILIATGNAGKLREYREMFAGLPFEIVGLADVPPTIEPEETGETFEENAILKAKSYAEQSGMWVLADDSGLEIAALGGAPGVHSARFAGRDTPYAEKMATLLEMIRGTDRSARFACVIALARPKGEIDFTATGECRGTIAKTPRGGAGFGYDPIFIPDGFDRTFGELPDAVKLQIGHRGRAASIIIRYLLDFIAV